MAAELEDAGLERQPRARRGLLEDQRDGAALERARGERRRLELERRARAARAARRASSSAPVRKWRGKRGRIRGAMRVLTWNLFHGRAVPPRRARPAAASSPRALAGWAWDVALLQEVPPWWPPALGAAAAREQRTALTSRNALPAAAPRDRARAARTSSSPTAAAPTRSSCAARRSPSTARGTLRRWPGAPRGARRAAGRRDVGGQPARAGALRAARAGRPRRRARAVTLAPRAGAAAPRRAGRRHQHAPARRAGLRRRRRPRRRPRARPRPASRRRAAEVLDARSAVRPRARRVALDRPPATACGVELRPPPSRGLPNVAHRPPCSPLAACAALVAGCGSSELELVGHRLGPGPGGDLAPAAPSAAAGGAVKIAMKNIQFAPQKARSRSARP